MAAFKDPVCDMMVEQGTEAGTFVYQGTTYYFCSASCLERFKEDPERFLAVQPVSAVMPLHPDRTPSHGTATVVLPIEGMSCASCVAKIEKSLSGLDGVSMAAVNFGTEKAVVKYDPGLLDMDDFKLAVASAGAYRILENADDPGREESLRNAAVRSLKIKFIFSTVVAMITMVLGMRNMVPFLDSIPARYTPAVNVLMFALTVPVLFWAGGQFFRGAYAEAKHASTNMDTLIALGTSVAFIFSTVITFFRVHSAAPVYFDTTAWIIALILLGRLLEATAKGRTTGAIKALMSLKPQTARLISNGQETEVMAESVAEGDILRVKPGDKIPVDGMIIEGGSTIDESMLTGESVPVEKAPGSEVFAGTMNASGSFLLKAVRVGTKTALAGIIRLVAEAQGSKAPVERLADTVAGYFVPAVIGISIVTGVVWFIAGHSLAFALTNLVSVLIVACPCALGLATPTAVIVGIGKAARHGILIKGGESLEKASGIQRIVFDKTGTLTQGKPELTDIIPVNTDRSTLLSYTASVESLSEHPLAQAIVKYAARHTIPIRHVDAFEAQPGTGIAGTIGDVRVSVGKPGNREGQELAAQGKTVLVVRLNGTVSGILGMQDVPKLDAQQTVEKLQQLGMRVAMVTGDNEETASAIAGPLGIKDVRAGVLPAGKAQAISGYQRQGDATAMVGDGINDAPALMTSDLGIAIGAGTDAAIEASDITVLGNELTAIPWTFRLSRATMRTIRQNLFWAFFYNIVAIPVAAGVLYPWFHILLNPVIAAFAMAFSSVSVVSNSLRLKNASV